MIMPAPVWGRTAVYELSDRQLPRQQINNVRGAAVALLRGLQTAAGAGGSAHGTFIELQVGALPRYVHRHEGFSSGRAGLTESAAGNLGAGRPSEDGRALSGARRVHQGFNTRQLPYGHRAAAQKGGMSSLSCLALFHLPLC